MLIASSLVRLISGCTLCIRKLIALQRSFYALKTYLAPAARPPAIFMLDQQVPYANLAFLRSAVTLGDILFQLLCVCSWRGFPLGGFLGFVEIIREILGL